MALLERYANHFIARTVGPIPRSMLGGEQISAIFFRELLAVVESEPQRRVMRLQQDIRHDGLGLHLRMLARQSWIFVLAQVEPRPPVESAFLHVRDVVRH